MWTQVEMAHNDANSYKVTTDYDSMPRSACAMRLDATYIELT